MKKIICGLCLAAILGCLVLYNASFGGTKNVTETAVDAVEELAPSYDVIAADDADEGVDREETGETEDIADAAEEKASDALKITEAGSYTLSGDYTGRVLVKAGEEDSVELILDGAVITNETGPAIKIKSAAEVTITLAAGSENQLCSGAEDSSETSGSAINSYADLTIAGDGSLTVVGNCNNGIHAQTDLTIESGTLTVISAGDCIQADGTLTVSGGELTLMSGGLTDASEISVSASEDFGRFSFSTASSDSDVSQKGLKAESLLVIEGGSVTVIANDDALHCNGSVEINGGTLCLASADDGIHADDSLTINGGDIGISVSYEGIEAQHITINDGSISVVSSDDGLNANGGSGMGFWGPGGQSSSEGSEELPSLVINGGTLYVNASGDGLDSNGDEIINGGTVIVDGPSTSANGALDSGSENGGCLLVNGGTLLAVGASGMAESPEEDSLQAFVYANVSFSAGSEISVTDAEGTVLISHTAARSGGNIVFSSPELTDGAAVTVTVDGQATEVTVGESTGGYGGGGFGGRGGFGGEMGGKGGMSADMDDIPNDLEDLPVDPDDLPVNMEEMPFDMDDLPEDMESLLSEMGDLPFDMDDLPEDMEDLPFDMGGFGSEQSSPEA